MASWTFGLTLLAGVAVPARADVFEIDDTGGVHTRASTAAVQWVDAGGRHGPADETAADDADPGMTDEERAQAMRAVPESAVSAVADPHVPEAMRAPLQAAAAHYKLSPALLAALVSQESGWHPRALSAKGAVGLAQLMPATAKTLAVNAHDPAANLEGGAHYLRTMLDLFNGDVERALAAYNAGPGRVLRAGGLPRIAETRVYVSTIIDRLSPAVSLVR